MRIVLKQRFKTKQQLRSMDNQNKTNFDLIKQFHHLFNLDVREVPYLSCFQNQKLMKLRLALIDEEVQELHDAVEQSDFIEVIDAGADLLYVVYGMFSALGVDANEAFRLVHESNMTKLCNSEQEAIDTVEWYKEKRPEFEAAYERHVNGKWRVFDKKSGKVLKNKYYKPVDLKGLCGLSS